MLDALIERVKALLLKPGATWDVIDSEEVDVQALYKSWIIPLAVITPLATFIGMTFVGRSILGVTVRTPLLSGLVFAVVSFAVMLGMVYVIALIIDALAPRFGAEKNFNQAFKTSAYFPVAAWVAGVVGLLPSLAVVSVIGFLYSLYLLFVGLPKMMKPPQDKAMSYTIVTLLCAAGAWIIVSVVASSVTGGAASANMRYGANGRITTTQLEANVRKRDTAMERAAESGDFGDVLGAVLGAQTSGPTVTPDALVDIAPRRLAGLTLNGTSIEETSMPFDSVTLTADYRRGDKSMTVTIMNSPMLSSMQGLMGLGAGTYNRRDGRNFERLRRDGDTLIIEEWNDEAERGVYGRTVGDTFMVNVSGHGMSLRELERAASEFSERKLNRLPTREG